MQLLLIGPSGSGKDTQASLISRDYNLKWVSVGELCRKRALIKDEEGEYVAKIINAGKLLEWDHLLPILKSELKMASSNFIWTGFPRLYEQSVEFDKLIVEFGNRVDYVIHLNLDEKTTKERIENRRNTSNFIRVDDSRDDLIENRMNYYKDSISQIEEYYSKDSRFVDINASGNIEEVYKNIKDNLAYRIKADE